MASWTRRRPRRLIQHEGQCAHCQGVRAQLSRSRELMRSMPPYSVSSELRAAVRKQARAVDRAVAPTPAPTPELVHAREALGWGRHSPRRRCWRLCWLRPGAPDVSTQLVANHLRAMELDSHLIDVASSEHHTVKPWFAGKVNFAPLVKQLDADGYVLKGGRVDIVEGTAAAVLVYGGRAALGGRVHVAGADGQRRRARASSADGFQLRHWEEGGTRRVVCVGSRRAGVGSVRGAMAGTLTAVVRRPASGRPDSYG